MVTYHCQKWQAKMTTNTSNITASSFTALAHSIPLIEIFSTLCGSYLFSTKRSVPNLAIVSLNLIGYIDAS